jgi:hypothetical protein
MTTTNRGCTTGGGAAGTAGIVLDEGSGVDAGGLGLGFAGCCGIETEVARMLVGSIGTFCK